MQFATQINFICCVSLWMLITSMVLIDVHTVQFVEFYNICPTNHNTYFQYLFLKALLHVLMFIHHPKGVLIMYAKVT